MRRTLSLVLIASSLAVAVSAYAAEFVFRHPNPVEMPPPPSGRGVRAD